MSIKKFISLALLIPSINASIEPEQVADATSVTAEVTLPVITASPDATPTTVASTSAAVSATEAADTRAAEPAESIVQSGLRKIRSLLFEPASRPSKRSKVVLAEELGDCQVCQDLMSSEDSEQHSACSKYLHRKCSEKWRFRQSLEGKPGTCLFCLASWPLDAAKSSLTAEEEEEIRLSVQQSDAEKKADDEAASLEEARRVQHMLHRENAIRAAQMALEAQRHAWDEEQIALMLSLQESSQQG